MFEEKYGEKCVLSFASCQNQPESVGSLEHEVVALAVGHPVLAEISQFVNVHGIAWTNSLKGFCEMSRL